MKKSNAKRRQKKLALDKEVIRHLVEGMVVGGKTYIDAGCSAPTQAEGCGDGVPTKNIFVC